MLYLDANVFLYPALYRGPKARAAAALLADVVAGDSPAATCALTVDEVVWALARETGRETAIAQGRRILSFANLRFLDVEAAHARAALALMEKHRKLKPRDALHAAVALAAGIHTVVSDDADFDLVPALDRQPLA